MISTGSDLSSHTPSVHLNGDLNADKNKDLTIALPDEILLLILSYLNAPALTSCQGVCRRWRVIVRGEQSAQQKIQQTREVLDKIEQESRFIGSGAWKLLGGIGEVPPLPDNILEELMKPCPFWNPKGTADGKKVKDTHVLGLMVDKVGGKPVTINSIEECAKAPKEGVHATQYRHIWDQIHRDHGETAVGKPYWALMTADVLPGSRRKSRQDQLDMAAKFCYEAPTLLQAIAFNIVRYVSTGKWLFSFDPCTYTCCKEQSGGWKLVVGGFSSSGLFVSNFYDDCNVGVAALRKF
ncbi:MAG: F-box protein [Chlamydiales bacterium]|nr:F-box protein [Chlamydiales bacterium]